MARHGRIIPRGDELLEVFFKIKELLEIYGCLVFELSGKKVREYWLPFSWQGSAGRSINVKVDFTLITQ
jgi:hypothetical protein